MTDLGDAKRAVEQLRQIQDLRSIWKDDWHETEARKRITELQLEPLPKHQLVATPDAADRFHISFGTRFVIAPTFSPSYSVQGPNPGDRDRFLSGPPRRLSEFKTLWDSLAKTLIDVVISKSVGTHALLLHPNVEIVDDESSPTPVRRSVYPPRSFRLISLKPPDAADVGAVDPIGLGFTYVSKAFSDWVRNERPLNSLIQGIAPIRDFDYAFTGALPDGDEMIIVPVQAADLRFNGQVAFQSAHETKFHYGPFSTSFPELERLTTNFQDLPFNQLAAILENEAKRAPNQVEIFGAKIPRSALTTWGIPIILGIQAYFVLHLVAFARLVFSADNLPRVPWIGLYTTSISKLATLISATTFPLVVVVVVLLADLIHDTLLWWGWLLALGAIGLSTLATLATAVCFWRIWARAEVVAPLVKSE